MDGAKLGCTDGHFIDGFHGSELVYGRIIEQMASSGSIIQSYADLPVIARLLRKPYSGLVFENPFSRVVPVAE